MVEVSAREHPTANCSETNANLKFTLYPVFPISYASTDDKVMATETDISEDPIEYYDHGCKK